MIAELLKRVNMSMCEEINRLSKRRQRETSKREKNSFQSCALKALAARVVVLTFDAAVLNFEIAATFAALGFRGDGSAAGGAFAAVAFAVGAGEQNIPRSFVTQSKIDGLRLIRIGPSGGLFLILTRARGDWGSPLLLLDLRRLPLQKLRDHLGYSRFSFALNYDVFSSAFFPFKWLYSPVPPLGI